ncbi:protein of unknown function [Nitrosotalea devaniterrae]|uniref:DUF2283 domain-containing protein n=1 Tax=Nitrosotalea devaniterrae TaxID=1078905 RepID=A0A128A4B5_9ARCH|nr:protein of unknown function [Candidatus Nitrosotalea devanaterra]
MVSIKFDKESGAMYVQLRKGKVTKTIPVGKDRFIDVNEAGKIVGVEVLMPVNAPEVNEAIAKSSDIIELEQ